MEGLKTRKWPGWLKCLLPWHVPTLRPVNLKTPKEWRVQHDEVSATVRRILIILIGYCFFSMLSLGISDVSVVLSNSKAETVKIPFASINVSFIGFVVIGPLVLLGLSVYMHIFVTYLVRLGRDGHTNPYIFNLSSPLPRVLAFILLYLLPLATILLFTYRSLPIKVGGWLTIFTSIVLIMFVRIIILHISHQAKNAKYKAVLRQSQGLLTSLLIIFIITQFLKLTLHEEEWIFKRDYVMKNENLDGRGLRYVKMDNINLRGASLVNSDFSATSLIRSDLSNVRAHEANFKGADLRESTLIEADFTGANLSNSNLKSANMKDSIMTSANLEKAKLVGVNLMSADLTDAKLNNAKLINTVLSDVKLDGTILQNATIGKNVGIDSSGKRIHSQLFAGGAVTDVDFTQARFISARFNCDYVEVQNIPKNKIPKFITPSKIQCTRLFRVTFNGARLYGAEFKGATLIDSKFKCVRSGEKSSCTHLRYAKFNCSFLVFSKELCAYLRGTVFEGADMQGANFNGSRLVNVDFKCSEVKGVKPGGITIKSNVKSVKGKCSNLKRASFTCLKLSATRKNIIMAFQTLARFAKTRRSAIRRTRKCTLMLSTDFTGVNLSQANFEGARLHSVEFKCRNQSIDKINCVNASYTKFGCHTEKLHNEKCALLNRVTFQGTNLSNANFSGAQLMQVKFEGNDLKRVNFTNAKLYGVKFSCVKEEDGTENCVDMRHVDLSNATFEKPRYRKAKFLRSDLRGVVNLTCSQLTKANNWEYTLRDKQLACGRPIPKS